MIINDFISIKIYASNINYWKNKNFNNIYIGTIIKVKVNDLPNKSSIMIDCQCDECGRKFSQRKYRNLDVCGYCLKSSRMKGNTFGSRNIKFVCDDIEKFKNLIELDYGKKQLSEYFGVNIMVINRWLKENGIILKGYKGTTYFKSNEEEILVVNKIKNLVIDNKTKSEICNTLNITRQVLNTIVKNYNIATNNKFTIWKNQYNDIMNNIELYVQENQTKTLNQISIDYNISVEQLKKAFSESNINPKIHSYNKSKGELECRDFIRSLNFNCDSYRFEKKYEIDCYVQLKKFGVEYCGEFWHKYDSKLKNKNYHLDKMNFFKEKNIILMMIFENEWKNKNEIVKSMIKSRLGIIDEKIFARKCIVKKIDRKDAEIFHLSNHISGKTTSLLNYGLFYNDILVSVLSLIRSRFDKNFEYEISRFSCLKNTIVVGGLSKLFTFFINEKNPNSCMTYSDLRFGEGKSYEKIGFTLLGTTTPNYHYYNNKVGILESRMKYQKAKLKNMKEYSIDKTEFQIMSDAGYYILYDCGNKKYGWRK